jgi:hypothetical protein
MTLPGRCPGGVRVPMLRIGCRLWISMWSSSIRLWVTDKARHAVSHFPSIVPPDAASDWQRGLSSSDRPHRSLWLLAVGRMLAESHR